MPIEIRELYIKVTVDDPTPGARDNSSSASTPGSNTANDAIVEKCIEQVMDIINNKKER
ncbi:DUF5908 family protein [Chitinophagaceae bacterium MMS25-I14]